MKKLLSILLAILMLCSCAQGQVLCPVESGTGTDGNAPPDVFIEYGGSSIAATKGSYDWEQDNGDGTATNTIACGIHPLQYDNIAEITAGKADGFTLIFGEKMLSFELSRWEVENGYISNEAGASGKIGEEEKIEAENGKFAVPADGKTYIYMLKVTYENGTAEYGFRINPADGWGISLEIIDVTTKGATLVFTQSGGNYVGELITGSYYRIESADNEELAFLVDDVAWTSEAYVIPRGGRLEMPVEWKWLYGELPDGTYRIYKTVRDDGNPGDLVRELCVEFTIGEKKTYSVSKLKIVDGAEEGKLVLAGTGAGEVYTLNVSDIPVYLDGEKADASALEDGMTAEIRYNGEILETYPASFGDVYEIHVYSLGTKNNPGGTYYDLCGLYLKVLDDLWKTDSGLNDGAEYVSIDLSEAPGNLTEGEKAAIAWIFGCEHGVEALTMTMEELVEEGWLVAAGGSNDLYQWDNGVLMTITDDYGEDQSDTPDAFYSLPVIKFNAMKWRSPLGAYIFSGCSAVWPQMGTWTDYNVGAHAIS